MWEIFFTDAINTAVDLIVAHFGTSRDPGVKAKLGNSSVSPNVGHLILKYLCPAVRDVLQDGLRAYVLDIIIGQRRNQPWSVVEASTQLGPSTRVLHNLFSKVSQYAELTNHSMRLNAFIFGLLNLRSLEFWFNHIYTHEDVIAAHYQPWGFLSLSQGACQPMLEELLLLLQPLSLLPFDLDLLFEPRQLQKGQEHLKRKEQLCSTRHGLDQSARSTFQLMRGGCGAQGAEPRVKGVGGEDGERERKRERSKQAGWWFQLMQSSQVYIDNSAHGSKFVKWEKRKKEGEGVVEGAEANHESDERAETERTNSTSGRDPSWMGSPPESVLTELKRSKERQPDGQDRPGEAKAPAGAAAGVANLRWGRLFGAGNTNRTEKPEQKSTKNQKSRSVHIYLYEVRALCHHIATEPGHLSFHKGDVLQVLSRADSDWLLCALGDAQGLVPIIYVTLNNEECQGPDGPQ
uniref:RUN and SH3 domain containing 2 n=1 Tax=Astyanax mexicanus TaxID=7994 RepID=A0A3B1IL08_ASTMX